MSFFFLDFKQRFSVCFEHHFGSSEIYCIEVIHHKCLQLDSIIRHSLVKLSLLLKDALPFGKKIWNLLWIIDVSMTKRQNDLVFFWLIFDIFTEYCNFKLSFKLNSFAEDHIMDEFAVKFYSYTCMKYYLLA